MKTLSTKHKKRTTKSIRKAQRKSKKSMRKKRRSRGRRIGGDNDCGKNVMEKYASDLPRHIQILSKFSNKKPSCGQLNDPSNQILCDIDKIKRIICQTNGYFIVEGDKHIEINTKMDRLIRFCKTEAARWKGEESDWEEKYGLNPHEKLNDMCESISGSLDYTEDNGQLKIEGAFEAKLDEIRELVEAHGAKTNDKSN